MVQPFGHTDGQFLKKLNVELLSHPAILLFHIYPGEMETYVYTTKIVYKSVQQHYP